METVEDLHGLGDETWRSDPEPQAQPAGATLRDRLRARRDEIAGRETCDLPIPGYNGELVARYRLLNTEALDTIGQTVRRQYQNPGKLILYGSIGILLAACEGFAVPHPETGELVDLDPEAVGKPMRYDHRLAEFLGLDVNPTQPGASVVFGVFVGPGGQPNETAIIEHAQRLQLWMADTSRKVDEQLWG